MAIKTNTGTMSKAFFGTSAVKKMYFGSSLVFSASALLHCRNRKR